MRRSKRASAKEAVCPVATLPLARALEHVVPFLLVHERARAACVCRGWRAALAHESLWLRLDLSRYPHGFLNGDALLLGAAGRARGRLSHLDVSGPLDFKPQSLQSVLTANADHLRELRLRSLDLEEPSANPLLRAVLRAAPLLQVLEASVSCDAQDARAWLRAGPPLQLRSLSVDFRDNRDIAAGFGSGYWPCGSPESVLEFAALMKEMSPQPALSAMHFQLAMTGDTAAMDAMVDVALSQRLKSLTFLACTPPAAPPLARLLTGGDLQSLAFMSVMTCMPAPVQVMRSLFNEAGAKVLADALRSTTTLTDVVLMCASLTCDMGAAAAFLGACAGHPSLKQIAMTGESAADPAALGAMLASIVAADSPALCNLYLSRNQLGDVGLAPIVDALPRNRHLRQLVITRNGMSNDFARLRLLPALRANTGLLNFECTHDTDAMSMPAAAAAEKLIAKRRKGRPAAEQHPVALT